MFGNLFNSITQGSEAAKAARVIQDTFGIVPTEFMLQRLKSTAQVMGRNGAFCNSYDYAFLILFEEYVDMEDSFANQFRSDKVNKDSPIRLDIIAQFDRLVREGLIQNSYVINQYELAKKQT